MGTLSISNPLRWQPQRAPNGDVCLMLGESQLIGDVTFARVFEDRAQNQAFTERTFFSGGSTLSPRANVIVKNGDFVLAEIGQRFGAFSIQERVSSYYMQYEMSNVAGKRLATQIAIYNDFFASGQLNIGSSSLTNIVFLDHLMPKADGIMADMEQSVKGRDFWLRMLAVAFGSGKFVYVTDRNTGTQYRIDDLETLRSVRDVIWGKDRRYAFVRPIISVSDIYPNAAPIRFVS